MCLKVEDCRQSSVVSSFLAQYAWMAKKGEIKFYYYIYIILIILYYIFLYSYIYIIKPFLGVQQGCGSMP